LYTQGVNIHHHNIYHENAFLLACGSGNLPLAQWIHSLRIDIVTDIYGDSALAYAAKFGHTHMIPWLCKHLPVNHPSNVGYTPFLQACREGYLTTAKKLYEHGADIHLTDSLGRSPLFHAVNGDHLDLVKWLGSFGIIYEERLLRTTPDYLMDSLFLLGACHAHTSLYTTPFMKQLYRSHTWFRLRKRMKRHYDQRILLLGKNKTDFDSWMNTLPWCSDVSLLIGDFVGILRYPQWDRVLTL
jgi:ankyrin repeat protein